MNVLLNPRQSLYYYAYESIFQHKGSRDVSTPVACLAAVDFFYLCGAINTVSKLAVGNIFYIVDGEFPTINVVFFYLILLAIEIYFFRRVDVALILEKFEEKKSENNFGYRYVASAYTLFGLVFMSATF